MSKIGTAHVEIKPVLNRESLDALCDEVGARVELAVRDAVARGLSGSGATQIEYDDVKFTWRPKA